MKLRYKDKEIKLVLCNTFFSRFKGFMFTKNISHALLFKKCNAIHTFFMWENIDIILCNEDNVILEYYNDVKENQIIIGKKGVTRVYEVPVNYFDIKVNDKLEVD